MLSTHVLDLARGAPGAGIDVVLHRASGTQSTLVTRATTNADGRIPSPFGGELEAGWYELVFSAGAYFARAGVESFYDQITVRFRIDPGTEKYHVPLLLAPWGYSTYRGS